MLLPALDSNNEAFWTGGREGVLLIHRCADCEAWVHPPVPYCAACTSRNVVPQPVSGRGRVYCYTVNHNAAWLHEGEEWQRVIALVELDEQAALRVLTNIVGCEDDQLRSGLPVEVTFHEAEDVFLPIFRPRDPGR